MKGPQDKQPGSPDQQDHEEKPASSLIAKVLEYEPYLLALEMERDQVCTYLLGEMLKGNPSAEPQILELVEFVKQEGIDLKVGQLEASRRLRETWEAFKTLQKTDIIRLLYDNSFDPYQTEIPSPRITPPATRKQRIPILQPRNPQSEFTDSMRQRLKEQALTSLTEGLERYLENVAAEIDRKVEEAIALDPLKQPVPQTVSFSTFSLEDWDPVTDDNIVIVREKPRPRITLDTNPGNNNLKSRLQ